MTRELPDELLSAYLDGEVTAEERAAVEAHLATSDAARQLLSELQSLRSDMGALPRAKVDADFTDRVVQAAIAAKAAASESVVVPVQRSRRTWMLVAAATTAAAACLLIAVQFLRPGPNPPIARPSTPVDTNLIALHSALPTADGEAVVLRLRLPKGLPLERALAVASASAGIGSRTADAATGANELATAYKALLTQRISAEATIAAADAVFVEAQVSQLEKLFAAIGADAKGQYELRREAQLAFPRSISEGGAAGEGPENAVSAAKFFMQHLPAGFRLEKQPAPVAATPTVATVSGDRLVRVLILIEQVEPK
jgi:anti-sigma factor RsiW